MSDTFISESRTILEKMAQTSMNNKQSKSSNLTLIPYLMVPFQ